MTDKTTATERLRQLLDERGVEHYDGTEGTLWGKDASGYRFSADELTSGRMSVHMWCETPDQAVEATLGPAVPPPEPPVVPYDLLIDLLRDVWGIEASWDGLRKFWYLGWTDEYVEDMGRLHDELCDAVAEASTVKAHRILDRARCAGRRTCKMEQHGSLADWPAMACWSCSECGFGWHHSLNDKQFSYCPNCGRRVV